MTRPRSDRQELSAERFYLPRSLQLATVELDGPEAHHLSHVLRLGVGDTVRLFNGDGDEAIAEVAEVRRRAVELQVREHWTTPSDPREFIVATAMPKADRARWMVEKLTELGATRIIPLRTTRSIVDPGEGKLEKLHQAAVAACKQSGRSRLPKIESTMNLADVVRELRGGDSSTARKFLVAHPSAQKSLREQFTANGSSASIVIGLVGPEGGFTDEELAMCVAAGAAPVRLGSLILRIETAVIALAAACLLWNHEC